MNFEKDALEIEKAISDFKDKYVQEFSNNIGENPNAHILSNSPRCFVIPFSSLENNWSVQYHDFKSQLDVFTAAIKQLPIQSLNRYFSYILEHECLPSNQVIKAEDGRILYGGGYSYRIHPKVIEKLRFILK